MPSPMKGGGKAYAQHHGAGCRAMQARSGEIALAIGNALCAALPTIRCRLSCRIPGQCHARLVPMVAMSAHRDAPEGTENFDIAAYDARRIAPDERSCRNVTHYHRPRSDHAIVPDGHTG